jgi:hypothetical protein
MGFKLIWNALTFCAATDCVHEPFVQQDPETLTPVYGDKNTLVMGVSDEKLAEQRALVDQHPDVFNGPLERAHATKNTTKESVPVVVRSSHAPEVWAGMEGPAKHLMYMQLIWMMLTLAPTTMYNKNYARSTGGFRIARRDPGERVIGPDVRNHPIFKLDFVGSFIAAPNLVRCIVFNALCVTEVMETYCYITHVTEAFRAVKRCITRPYAATVRTAAETVQRLLDLAVVLVQHGKIGPSHGEAASVWYEKIKAAADAVNELLSAEEGGAAAVEDAKTGPVKRRRLGDGGF